METIMKHNFSGLHDHINDMPDADQTLKNVFESCNMKPNTLSIDELVQRAHENTSKYLVCMLISFAVLIVTFFIPLAFKPAAVPASSQNVDISVTSSEMQNGNFILHLSGFMIDYTSVYAIDSDDNTIYPVSYDAASGKVVFYYNDKAWNIYIPDLNGNQLHLLLTPDK